MFCSLFLNYFFFELYPFVFSVTHRENFKIMSEVEENAFASFRHLKFNFKKQLPQPLESRVQQLEGLRNLLSENKEQILEAFWEDQRKNVQIVETMELSLVLQEIKHQIDNLQKNSAPRPIEGASHIRYEPLGIFLFFEKKKKKSERIVYFFRQPKKTFRQKPFFFFPQKLFSVLFCFFVSFGLDKKLKGEQVLFF